MHCAPRVYRRASRAGVLLSLLRGAVPAGSLGALSTRRERVPDRAHGVEARNPTPEVNWVGSNPAAKIRCVTRVQVHTVWEAPRALSRSGNNDGGSLVGKKRGFTRSVLTV